MTSTLLLRVASVVALLFAAGHTLGGRKHWSPMGENPVLEAMTTVRFETMGVSRSYLDFYQGFGYSLSVLLLMVAVLLWQLASLARIRAPSVRPMIGVITLAILACGLVAWRYLFPLPAVLSMVLASILFVAYVVAR